MKVVAKPVEMVAWFEKTGLPHPTKFRFTNDEHVDQVIKIDKIITRDKEKLAGNDMLIFNCQSVVNNVLRNYQLKYELKTMKWILFKI